jgi:hypothetical protein
MMEVLSSTGKTVVARATGRNIPEHGILHSYRRENLKSYGVHVGYSGGHAVACFLLSPFVVLPLDLLP